MTFIIFGVLIVAALLLQVTWVPFIVIKGVRPDLLLIVVVSSALLLGKDKGAGVGFFSGMLQDLVSGNIFGLNILSKMATGFVAGTMERKVFKENLLLPIVTVAAATVFNSIVMLIILFILGYRFDLIDALLSTLYLLLYNACLAVPVHKVTSFILKISRQFTG